MRVIHQHRDLIKPQTDGSNLHKERDGFMDTWRRFDSFVEKRKSESEKFSSWEQVDLLFCPWAGINVRSPWTFALYEHGFTLLRWRCCVVCMSDYQKKDKTDDVSMKPSVSHLPTTTLFYWWEKKKTPGVLPLMPNLEFPPNLRMTSIRRKPVKATAAIPTTMYTCPMTKRTY